MVGAGAVGRGRARPRGQVCTDGRAPAAGGHTPPRRLRRQKEEEDAGEVKT